LHFGNCYERENERENVNNLKMVLMMGSKIDPIENVQKSSDF
jgi:hypothetical protein